jgi:hypothetical protein
LACSTDIAYAVAKIAYGCTQKNGYAGSGMYFGYECMIIVMLTDSLGNDVAHNNNDFQVGFYQQL